MTDTLFNEIEPEFCDMSAWDYFCEMTALATELERELTAVTEQRDGLRSGIDYASDQLATVTEQRDRLAEAIRLTLMENLDLCDGDICTLKRLKDAIGFDLDSPQNTKDQERTASPASDCSEIESAKP
jgi:hypothetical protein